eukprot:g1675.t1
MPLVLKIKWGSGSSSETLTDLNDDITLDELTSVIASKVELDVKRVQLKAGFPPEDITGAGTDAVVALGITSGSALTVIDLEAAPPSPSRSSSYPPPARVRSPAAGVGVLKAMFGSEMSALEACTALSEMVNRNNPPPAERARGGRRLGGELPPDSVGGVGTSDNEGKGAKEETIGKSLAGFDYSTGFTEPLEISTPEETKKSVRRMLTTVSEKGVSGLGEPTPGVIKMAVSYRQIHSELLTEFQAESLITALNAEREQNGAKAISLWFDRKMCAVQTPEKWFSHGLEPYKHYNVIRLLREEDTLKTVENCDRGWLRLEMEMGKRGGYVRVNEHTVSDCVEEEGTEEERESARVTRVTARLLKFVSSDDFPRYKFSQPEDVQKIRAAVNSKPAMPVVLRFIDNLKH